MSALDHDTAGRYLAAHGIHDPNLVHSISVMAAGNWLVLELAAETFKASPDTVDQDLPDLCATLLNQIYQHHGRVPKPSWPCSPRQGPARCCPSTFSTAPSADSGTRSPGASYTRSSAIRICAACWTAPTPGRRRNASDCSTRPSPTTSPAGHLTRARRERRRCTESSPTPSKNSHRGRAHYWWLPGRPAADLRLRRRSPPSTPCRPHRRDRRRSQ
jgi:hypothetical protein